MKNLLTFIYNELNDLGYGVYDKKPPEKAKYPFLEYSVNEPYRNTNPILYTLTIDIWDRNNSSYRTETVADEVDEILEDMSFNNLKIMVKVKRQSRLKLEDPDAEVKRRQLIYQLRVFNIC